MSAAADADGERRPITFLFCDLVDSTSLFEQLDPEDVRAVQNAVRGFFAQVASVHGGHIAEYVGDGVVMYFGYPRAREDDPERAIACGLTLAGQVGTKYGAVPLRAPLSVRVGIHTSHAALGPVCPDDDGPWAAFGVATSVAARLQRVASPGKVIVTDVTWQLARHRFLGRSLGEVTLEGLSKPVAAWRIEGEVTRRERDAAFPGASPFVGRGRERAILDEAWSAATAGETHFILLQGEPGMGKSRLTQHWRSTLTSTGTTVLFARAGTDSRNYPFHPIVALLEHVFAMKPASDTGERLTQLADGLRGLGLDAAAIVPFLAPLMGLPLPEGSAAPDLSYARRRNRSIELITEILAAIAARGPTLLIVEDLHWADESTRELLRHVVASLPRVGLLGMFTARPDLEPDWLAGSRLRLITLDKLQEIESEVIARAVAKGKALPGPVLRQILTRSEGVPLFVEELTRSVVESGVLRERSASWEVVDPSWNELIPMAVHALLTARIDRLGSARATAQLAAAIGREFSLALLSAVSDRDDATLRQDLRQLEDAGLAWESRESGPDTFVFKHALVRDAAYELLSRTMRQSYHSRIAGALRGALSHLATGRHDLIAEHLTRAGEYEDAVAFWEAAGHDSLQRTANLEAAGHFRRAIECLAALPVTPARKERELELQNLIAPVFFSVYGWASREAEQACQRARDLCLELERQDRLYPSLWGLWSVYFLRGQLGPALPAALAVHQMAEASGVPLFRVTGRHATSYTRLFRGEFEEALCEADAGLALFDFAQEQALATAFQLSSSVCLRQSRAQALWMLGRITEADQEAVRMLQLARDLKHPSSLAGALAFALHGGGMRYSYTGEMIRLRDIADELRQLSHDEGFFMWYAVAEIYRGVIGEALGESDARRRMKEGLELFLQTRTRVTAVMMNVIVAEALCRRGGGDEGLRRLDDAEAEAIQREERFYAPEIWRIRGRVFARRGLDARAEFAYGRALELATTQGARSLALRAALDLYDLYAAQGRGEEASPHLSVICHASQWPDAHPEFHRARAILAAHPCPR